MAGTEKRGASGYKFRRQQGIGPYVLDFYCPELRLCVELDGASHDYNLIAGNIRLQAFNCTNITTMREVNPKETSRARAFEMWMKAPMPMVTLFKTLRVGRLVRASRRRGMKFNMLLCWCIGRAASGIREFYMMPVGERLMAFNRLAINVVVQTRDGGISTCDIPFSENVGQFNDDYLRLTRQVHDTCQPYDLGDDYIIVGTSTLPDCEIDGAVNIYSGIYNNPFLVWGKYRHTLFKTTLPISFQFHHTQMDGHEAARFLNALQAEIDCLS